MSRANKTVNVRMAEELIQEIDQNLADRGFSNRSEFIRSAARDALQRENPYTEEAQDDIQQAREAYDQGEGKEIDSLLEEAGMDPLPEDESEEGRFVPSLYDEDQDTWMDETDVTIVGLGGAGASIVTRLHSEELDQADTVVIDTDETTLDETVANTRLHIELKEADPEDGPTENGSTNRIRQVMDDSIDELGEQLFESTDLVVIVSGIGGSAGTNLTPVISEAAQSVGAVVTTIATLPHTLEQDRRRQARDDIQEFRDAADTFVLIDAARFADFAPDLTPGEVFETINQYLETALRQMVDHREYLGEMTDDEDHRGLASFFRNGGYATLVTGRANESDELETLLENLYSRSLVDVSAESNGSQLHLVQLNQNKLEEEQVNSVLDKLLDEPTNLTPTDVKINLVANPQMDDAIRLTSILTGLEIDSEEIIDLPERVNAGGSEGRIILKSDNTTGESARSTEQESSTSTQNPRPSAA